MTDDLTSMFADSLGILPSYTALDGTTIMTSHPVKKCFIEAMRLEASERGYDAWMKSRWAPGLEPVTVVRPQTPGFAIWNVPHSRMERCSSWRLLLEDGSVVQGSALASECRLIEAGQFDDRRAFPLPELPAGYHRLELEESTSLVLCAPEQTYRPAVLDERGVWGPTIQLYAVRSKQNWGIGDFGDLCDLARRFADVGADFVGLNPLHALFPDNPAHCSPYSPSSRTWLNPIYIQVPSVPEVLNSAAAQTAISALDLDALRDTEFVDYPGVYRAKESVLQLAFEQLFGARREAFRSWVVEKGRALEQFARWETLQLHFAQQGKRSFADWPEPYQSPDSPLPYELESTKAFRQYLQWLAAEQLSEASAVARSSGMAIGIYTDLAVGVERAGAECWSRRSLYGDGASVGAPPDDFNLLGQDWGMPPPIPHAMRADEHSAFRETLVSSMQTSGALRIDHVMALRRLYWVPRGASAAEGAYVLYPFEELMALVTLESNRQECVVVGEDLGVVPPEVTDALHRSRTYSYRIMFFEQTEPGQFKSPREMLRRSLTVASTHDLPTLKGFWEGRDIEVRDELKLWSKAEVREKFVVDREDQRRGLMDALRKEELLPPEFAHADEAPSELPQVLADALMVYLARGKNELMAIQLEDVVGQREQVNVPGTVDEHPNWKRKLSVEIEDLFSDLTRAELFKRITAARQQRPDA